MDNALKTLAAKLTAEMAPAHCGPIGPTYRGEGLQVGDYVRTIAGPKLTGFVVSIDGARATVDVRGSEWTVPPATLRLMCSCTGVDNSRNIAPEGLARMARMGRDGQGTPVR